ncbi:MAG: DnaA/Hda family protein [Methanomassiliicoccus sp.]|nr:DnaA/Hda family protein [Methanomassiliicoccus sp.]
MPRDDALVSVLLELGVPQGLVVSRWKGGDNVLETAVESARLVSLNGYIKIVLGSDGERSESLLSISAGAPSLCLYVFRPVGLDELWFLGEKAAEYLWYDAINSEASISLHSEVNLRDFEQLFPGAKVRRVEAPRHVLSPEKLRADKVHRAEAENTGEHLLGIAGLGNPAGDKKVERQAQGVYDLILHYQKMRSDTAGLGLCEDCGGPIDLLGYCPRCATREEEAPSIPRMDPRETFGNFVGGPGSRFAEAAARAVAAEPGRRYNPLVIHSRPGMGKSHLLQAVGHEIKRLRRELNITYLPLDSVDIGSSESVWTSLHQELEMADTLLIDDLQFLSGKDRFQEEIMRAINRMVTAGKQVVVTADRLPRRVPLLMDRLASRLESGLVVDIGPLDQATRLEILRRVASRGGSVVPDDVLQMVAESCPDSVSQLEGGMNRVLAFASLMGSEVTADLTREVLGPGDLTPIGEIEVRLSRSYFVEEARPERAYDLVGRQVDRGARALIFSRNNPGTVSDRLGGRKAEIYWLTEHESRGSRTVTPSLEKLMMLAEDHIHREGQSVVLLDDLHYLISNAGFEGVIRFIRSLVDEVSERQSVFMVSVSPESLKVQERSVLEREMEPIRP